MIAPPRVREFGGAGTFGGRLTNGSAVTDTYSYDVFGAVRSQTGTSADYWLFTGEQRDGDSGFYYLWARYYDPSIGRFFRCRSRAVRYC